MSEAKIESVIRDFSDAVAKGDVEKALSFFAEDATWVNPVGTFKGKEELKRYLTWQAELISDLTIMEAGVRIMLLGDKAVQEQVVAGTTEGMKWQAPAVSVYEFSDDKIQHLRCVYDRLSMLQQAAKGWVAKRIVSSIVKRAEKGLR